MLRKKKILSFLTILLISGRMIFTQDYRFGIYASPVISWFNTDISEVRNEGSRAGFNFCATAERYFSDNYALAAGISIINSGGRLVSSSASTFRFTSFTSVVAAGNAIVYRIQYLAIPVGLKVKTNEIGVLAYFGDLGLDPKMVIRGRVDIPSIDIKGQKAMTEISRFNMGYHITGGIDYSLDGTTSLILGLGFENNFFDVTKDIGDQKDDRASHKFLKFIFGINF